MNWKVSYSDLVKPGISRSLLRENFRRFWPIPVLAFLFYFLSGPFTLLMNYGNMQNKRYYIVNMLENNHVGFIVLHMMVPIIAAVIVFRYLQQPGNVTTTHALPFSRSTLFNTNFLSGFLMSALPIAATGVILFVLKRPVYTPFYGDETLWIGELTYHADFPGSQVFNVFSGMAVLQWLIISLVTVLFIYTITVFAGVVTGVSLLHFGFGGWFNFLVPLVWLCMFFYFDLYWFGFNESGSLFELTAKMNPILFSMIGQGIPWAYVLLFALLSVLIAFLSKWFYFARPMERVGDALTFRFMQPLLNYILAFMSMTLFGLYFDQTFGTDFAAPLGIVIGAILGFVIGRMVVTKTLLIFNKQTLKSFTAYAVIAAVLLSSVHFDIYGYEKRVPQVSSVKEMSMPLSNIFRDYTQATSAFTEDPKMMEYMTAIHQEIIDNKALIESGSYSKTSMTVNYVFKNGWDMSRRYRIPYEYLYQSEAMRTWFNSPERRDLILHGFDNIQSLNYVQIYDYPMTVSYLEEDMKVSMEQNPDYGNTMLYPNVYDLDGLLDAICQDSLELSYAASMLESSYVLEMELNYRTNQDGNPAKTNSRHITVTPQMTHTLQWLKDNKICDPLQDLLNATAGIVITPNTKYSNNIDDVVPEGVSVDSYEIPVDEMADIITVEDALIATPIPTKEAFQVTAAEDSEPWDGKLVYRYDSYTGTLQPVLMSKIQSELGNGFLVTDPEDIRQILSWSDYRGGDENLFNVEFLYKYKDDRLSNRFTAMNLSPGVLSMEECDFAVTPDLAQYINQAFQ